MLRGRSRATATTVAIALVLAVAALMGSGANAAPARAAVPTVPQPKQQIIVFVPHADDDVLSMGVFIEQEIKAGKDVRVVYYTDGAGTGVCGLVDGYCRSQNKFEGETEGEFIEQRDSELMNSVTALGVTPDHVDKYAVDGVRPHDGLMTVDIARTMLTHYHQLYPDATLFTMSWLDAHPDHGSAGLALHDLVDQGVVPKDEALFTMARWYWAYDYPSRSQGLQDRGEQVRANYGYPTATVMMSCDVHTPCGSAVQKAVSAYGPCPAGTTADQCTGIGYMSVQEYLDVTNGDPRIIIHGVDAAKYPSQVSTVTATRSTANQALTRLTGTIRVPAFGRYATDPTKPANAQWLVETIGSSHVKNPFAPGNMATVTSLDARRRPMRSARVELSTRGTFTVTLPVAAAASTVRVTADATRGTLPASLLLPVVRQRVTPVATSAVTVRRGVIHARYGQRVTVSVKATVNGKTVARAVPTVRTADGLVTRRGKTSKRGLARLAVPVSASRSLLVSTATAKNTVPSMFASIRTSVAPAVLKVRSARASVHAARGVVGLRGSVAGRDYRIAKSLLVPVTVRVYRAGKNGKAVYASSVRTARGGAFSVTVPARKGEKISFRVVGVRNVFSTVKNAGTVKVA